LPLPIAQAIEKLQKGKVSDPIGVQGKWWLIKLDDVRPVKMPPFEQARQEIYNTLTAEALERAAAAQVQKLSQGATIVR
jgi:peptidyl-prolyl cis-trans isomerase C